MIQAFCILHIEIVQRYSEKNGSVGTKVNCDTIYKIYVWKKVAQIHETSCQRSIGVNRT